MQTEDKNDNFYRADLEGGDDGGEELAPVEEAEMEAIKMEYSNENDDDFIPEERAVMESDSNTESDDDDKNIIQSVGFINSSV